MSTAHSGKGQDVPCALEPPVNIDPSDGQGDIWVGESVLCFPEKSVVGRARVFFDLLPVPGVRFEFDPKCKPTLKDRLTEEFFQEGVLKAGEPLGDVRVRVSSVGNTLAGKVVEQIKPYSADVAAAKFLVVNGPQILGSTIRHEETVYAGRVHSSLDGLTVTLDRIDTSTRSRRAIYECTHVALVEFKSTGSARELEAISGDLFRALSLMRCLWVGLVGPWIFDERGSLVSVCPSVTKVFRSGTVTSWCHETIQDGFAELLPVLHASFQNSSRSESLQAAFHWLIEAEQCAGGVEGSVILQQVALESLAWLEVVQKRHLSKRSAFDKLPAAAKIRQLLNVHRILSDIPPKAKPILSYAHDNHLADLVDVLVHVRNALVHAEPKKVERLFSRTGGEDERSTLRYLSGGLLQQALLASLDYKGEMLRRDVDAKYACGAIRQVPWGVAK